MKKVLLGLVALLVILGGSGYAWYKISYGGTNYYLQVTQDGKKFESKDDSGKVYYDYKYTQDAFDKDGNGKKITFNADHNLKHEAYLKLTYNKTKGVTNWEEISKSEVPGKALTELNKVH